MNGEQLKMRCEWKGSCGLEFVNALEYRRHCNEHIEANIAAARRLRNLPLPVETWTEVFSNCGPESLKEQVCFSQHWFHGIARLLLDGPKGRILPAIGFLKLNGNGAENDETILRKHIAENGGGFRLDLEDIPIAEVPPPQSVVGFQLIELKCFDEKVLSFMCAIRNLLNDVHLAIGSNLSGVVWRKQQSGFGGWGGGGAINDGWGENDGWGSGYSDEPSKPPLNLRVLEHLLRVFPHLDQAITTLQIGSNMIDVALFARVLSNVRYLGIKCVLPPPDTLSLTNLLHSYSPYLPVLVKWLHTPAEDGHRKMARLNIGTIADLAELVLQAQEKFLSKNWVVGVSYFVVIYTHFSNALRVELPFNTICNGQHKELLTLRRRRDDHNFCDSLVLYRRSGVECSPPEEEVEAEENEADEDGTADSEEERELTRAMDHKLSNSISDSRNKLVLNISQMSEITDEQQLLPMVDGQAEDKAIAQESAEPGPSSAKKSKLDD